jgi:hypothetical protein
VQINMLIKQMLLTCAYISKKYTSEEEKNEQQELNFYNDIKN